MIRGHRSKIKYWRESFALNALDLDALAVYDATEAKEQQQPKSVRASFQQELRRWCEFPRRIDWDVSGTMCVTDILKRLKGKLERRQMPEQGKNLKEISKWIMMAGSGKYAAAGAAVIRISSDATANVIHVMAFGFTA